MSLAVRRACILIGLCLFSVAVWFPYDPTRARCDTTRLCVAFLDVGQGDAIYIRSPSGKAMLVDGGRDARVVQRIAEVQPRMDRKPFAFVLATHPDADHIGGLPAVLERYGAERVIVSSVRSSTTPEHALEAASEGKREEATFGAVYDLGAGVSATVVYPFAPMPHAETNDASIVLYLQYGASDVVLTGDAPKAAEYKIAHVFGAELRDTEILKAGHHGSRTSSSDTFIAALTPALGIISAGKDNRYGHPHQETLDVFRNRGVPLLGTADNGTLIVESNGSEMTVRRLQTLHR